MNIDFFTSGKHIQACLNCYFGSWYS